MRLPRTKSALFKATSNKLQESQLFSEIGLLEADLSSTRKDLHAANVRTKSLSSVLKDKSGKVQALQEHIASSDDLLKVGLGFALMHGSLTLLYESLMSLYASQPNVAVWEPLAVVWEPHVASQCDE